ncbi:MAG: hypothetical protein MRY76_13120 [Pseudomonadales bacterium]|nr:hypothetical protein [Pseudomonadales bacterium]
MRKTFKDQNLPGLAVAALATLFLSLSASPASAATVVRQVDAATLLVVEYRGKPPHKRRLVSADDTAAFAHYQEIMDRPSATLFSGIFRAGPPGKATAHSRRPMESDSGQNTEQVEFARFEETSAQEKPTRRFWRGAPGKGRPSLND